MTTAALRVLAAGVLSLAAVVAEGRTIVVDPSGAGDVRTIQAAAERKSGGDRLCLSLLGTGPA